MDDFTVTAAIIVKNEERCISRCIHSIVNVFDEIIIIDTGSDDNTVNIINSFNNDLIKTFSVEWHDSFSEARNIAIRKSTSDYIFFIDADEYLETSDKRIHQRITSASESNTRDYQVLCPKIIDHNGNVTTSVRRILPNNGLFFYLGYVHEDLRITKGSSYTPVSVDITLHHDGYTNEVIIEKEKALRNRKLNIRNITLEPENLRWYYFYYRDSFETLYPNEIYHSLLKKITLNNNQPLSYENIKQDAYTFAILDLIARACVMIQCSHSDFYLITRLMDLIVPNNTNSIYYNAVYELFNWQVKATRIMFNLVRYRKGAHQVHEEMLHSDGLHIDAAISFYLYEKKQYVQARKLLSSVRDCGFKTDLVDEYLKEETSRKG
ncbi:glycosyltransferase involved in cell wall biosynthesis [Enterobacter sp. BIGb0383]|uniref:glycosyltransferase family 2 protein n=1 Tax=unclassified Enterobacter TaxID=2608935 RepID=UPI000F477FA7|nr:MULTISPECIES: glycosyltransferase family 2 protein [unclassified Enterobacter]ROP62979.1 glycosyltransferase involved in cell wall biosynthesis [Enterobacter sp. BIGb0383]ROS13140.1 glycosyltransferase involved in cell wall biosynthesis [Enterobacter sp. BIGb0359]